MLKICTVYFKGFYTPDYVTKLYRSLKKIVQYLLSLYV